MVYGVQSFFKTPKFLKGGPCILMKNVFVTIIFNKILKLKVKSVYLFFFSIYFIPRMLRIKSVILRIILLLNQLMSEWNQPGFNSFLQIANKIVRKYWVIKVIIHSLLLHRMKAVSPIPDYLMCDVPSRRSLYNSIHRVNFWNIF